MAKPSLKVLKYEVQVWVANQWQEWRTYSKYAPHRAKHEEVRLKRLGHKVQTLAHYENNTVIYKGA